MLSVLCGVTVCSQCAVWSDSVLSVVWSDSVLSVLCGVTVWCQCCVE